ncbi:MAG: hypothetical protein ACREAC_00655, partial [Blastocatellia bacterium]
DWEITYVPGPRARREYDAFNRRRLKTPDRDPEPAKGSTDDLTAADIVAAFHFQLRGAKHTARKKELAQAQELLDAYGADVALRIAQIAADLANRDRFDAKFFGAASQYVEEALAVIALTELRDRSALEHESEAARDVSLESEARLWAEQEYGTMPKDQRTRLEEQLVAEARRNSPGYVERRTETQLAVDIKNWAINALAERHLSDLRPKQRRLLDTDTE